MRHRPPAAWRHDRTWQGPLGRERVRTYFETHPKQCVACGRRLTIRLHHIRYYPGATGYESDGTFRALCNEPRWRRNNGCHGLVHKWHRKLIRLYLDRWPYRLLPVVTDITIGMVRLVCRWIRPLPEWRTS